MFQRFLTLVVCTVGLLLCVTASAQVPQTLTYSGNLTSGGQPINEVVSATFTLYDAETDGQAVWTETYETLDVVNGQFRVELGAKTDITGVFDGQPYWLEIQVNSEALEPRMHVGTMPYAFKAADADRVGGYTAEELMGSGGSGASSAKMTSYDNANSTIAADNVKGALDEVAARLDALEAMEARIAALETKTENMSVSNDGEDVYFTGVNVHVRSGAGSTDATVNGLGNVIIGYDEASQWSSVGKEGSHNLVLGKGNSYSSYAGVVVGHENIISAKYATITGGTYNRVWGDASTVSGGHENVANAYTSAVCGGRENTTNANFSSITGGENNQANGEYSSVSGGNNRSVDGTHDWQAGTLFETN